MNKFVAKIYINFQEIIKDGLEERINKTGLEDAYLRENKYH